MRITVPTLQAIKVLDARSGRKGFSIQNVGSVDIYYSDDQRQLDSVAAANLPNVGHLLPTATPNLPPTIYPAFIGAIYVRAQSPGALLEIMPYDIDLCPGGGTGVPGVLQ